MGLFDSIEEENQHKINQTFKQRAENLAAKLDCTIDPNCPIELWPVEILENLLHRLEVLEGRVDGLY